MIDAERWRLALHEASHLCAAIALLGDRKGAAVVTDSEVAAVVDVPAEPVTFDEALTIAVGEIGESLAERHAPPSRPVTRSEDEVRTAAVLVQDVERFAAARPQVADAVWISRWCTSADPLDFERAERRFVWLRDTARRVVRDLERVIVAIAERLFVDGAVKAADVKRIMGGRQHENRAKLADVSARGGARRCSGRSTRHVR